MLDSYWCQRQCPPADCSKYTRDVVAVTKKSSGKRCDEQDILGWLHCRLPLYDYVWATNPTK